LQNNEDEAHVLLSKSLHLRKVKVCVKAKRNKKISNNEIKSLNELNVRWSEHNQVRLYGYSK
jgi:hypothetical protein